MASLADIRKQHPEYSDLSDQQLADGLYRKFYSDMPRDQFDKKLGINAAPTAAPVAAPSLMDQIAAQNASMRGVGQLGTPPVDPSQNPQNSLLPGPLGQFSNTVRAATEGAQQTGTLNLGDERFAAVAGLPQAAVRAVQGQGFDYPREVGSILHGLENTSAQTAALNPDAYKVGQTAGMFGLMGTPLARNSGAVLPALSGAAPLAKWAIPKAAAAGGLYSAASAFGEPGSLGDRAKNAAGAFLPGAAFGTVLGAGAKVLGGGGRPTLATAPTKAQFATYADAAFDAARATNAIVPKADISTFRLKFGTLLEDAGAINPANGRLTPQYQALQHAYDLAKFFAGKNNTVGMPIRNALAFRKALQTAAGSTEPAEAGLAMKALDEFDAFMETIPGSTPELATAVDAWGKGRRAWHIALKSGKVEKLATNAEHNVLAADTLSPDKAMRVETNRFVKGDEGRNLNGYTPQEKAALTTLATGTGVNRVARKFGNLSTPGLGWQNIFKVGPAAAAGTVLGSPLIGAAVAGGQLGLGAIGRFVANLSTRHQAELVQLIIRNGGKLPTKIPASLPPEIKRALGNLLLTGGSNASALGQQVLQMLTNQPTATPVKQGQY